MAKASYLIVSYPVLFFAASVWRDAPEMAKASYLILPYPVLFFAVSVVRDGPEMAKASYRILSYLVFIFLQQVWGGMYQRWQKYQPNHEEVWQEIARIKNNDKEVKSKVVRMRK